MRLLPGARVELTIDKPAAGGRMIGRLDGQVVFVSGAIPGERVAARVERVARGVTYAGTASVEVASPDRREPFTDPLCGGCAYAHIAYERQLAIKAQVIADTFARIGHLEVPASLAVQPSHVDGYRMRARLHLRDGRIGFFREGTHELCDARATRQLLPETSDVLDALGAALRSLGVTASGAVDVSENRDASERVVHLDAPTLIDTRILERVGASNGITGLQQGPGGGGPPGGMVGSPYVTDTLTVQGHDITWRRHVLAFFQGNRYLLPDLVDAVMAEIDEGSRVLDLYAGVGLFSIPAAVARRAEVTAVEGDGAAASDLRWNAEQARDGHIDPVHESVEAFTAESGATADVLIVDPPRTGLSKEALQGALNLQVRRVVYVSCDVATLARDARRIVDAGFTMMRLSAFDMFPNTPHVEVVGVFERI